MKVRHLLRRRGIGVRRWTAEVTFKHPDETQWRTQSLTVSRMTMPSGIKLALNGEVQFTNTYWGRCPRSAAVLLRLETKKALLARAAIESLSCDS